MSTSITPATLFIWRKRVSRSAVIWTGSSAGAIVVEVAPIHVGRTAFTLGYGIFDREGCVAVALNRSVCVDRSTGQKVPLTDAVSARLREIGRIG
jgi:hypothetical protein